MDVPIYIPLVSTMTSITVNVTPLTTNAEIGGYVVDSYHIEWDQGTNSWTSI